MKQQLIITLETIGPENEGPPVEIRWRRALKALLRTCGLRCRDVRIETSTDERKDDDE